MSKEKIEQEKQKKVIPQSILKDAVRFVENVRSFVMPMSDKWDDLVSLTKIQALKIKEQVEEIERLNKLLGVKFKRKLKSTTKKKGKN